MITAKGSLALLAAAAAAFAAVLFIAGGTGRKPTPAKAATGPTVAQASTRPTVAKTTATARAASTNGRLATSPGTTPSAADFAAELVGVTNQAADEHGDPSRISEPRCVQAAPGRYMCSYVVVRNGRSTCHLMQARWTPDLASTITITLSGRTARCRTLREAIRTLG